MSLVALFEARFGVSAQAQARVPGRVNLIGEHTDYNLGFVLPTVIDAHVTVAMARSRDRGLEIFSSDHPDPVVRDLEESKRGHWSDYVVAALIQAQAEGLDADGLAIGIAGDIPQGAGLSSSAALMVAVIRAVASLCRKDLAGEDIALMAQQGENDYIGVPCGVMDQMAVAIAQPGTALLLDTADLSYRLVPLFDQHSFMVLHSGLSRALSDGRYAQRREECFAAAEAFGLESLRDATPAHCARMLSLPAPLDRRMAHVISENDRVLGAVRALEAGDVESFGALMNTSHASLRDDFEVSLAEIDRMIEDAQRFGAVGARLTGGGFGGAIVALVRNETTDGWLDAMRRAYPNSRLISRVGPAADPDLAQQDVTRTDA